MLFCSLPCASPTLAVATQDSKNEAISFGNLLPFCSCKCHCEVGTPTMWNVLRKHPKGLRDQNLSSGHHLAVLLILSSVITWLQTVKDNILHSTDTNSVSPYDQTNPSTIRWAHFISRHRTSGTHLCNSPLKNGSSHCSERVVARHIALQTLLCWLYFAVLQATLFEIAEHPLKVGDCFSRWSSI